MLALHIHVACDTLGEYARVLKHTFWHLIQQIMLVVAVYADCLAMLQGAYSHSLAEWALTACSWFAKDLPRLKQQQKDRNWEPYYVEELRQATELLGTIPAVCISSILPLTIINIYGC